MQGKKIFEQKLFYSVTLEQLVPRDHPVRLMSEILDLSFVYEATREYYSHEGKPSIDPVVLFKLYLIGYFFGIPSERKLFREIQVNVAYRWYLGYDLDELIPDHSIMTKSRYRFPEQVFAKLFIRMIRLCEEKGLICGDFHFIDSSLIRADASKDSFRQKLMPVEDFLAGLPTAECFEKDNYSQAFAGKVDPERMGARRKRIRKSDEITSPSDPDAELVTRPGKGTFPAYKAHFCVDRRKRIILAVDGSAATKDDMTKIDSLFTSACLSTRKKPKVIVADSHYGGIEALKYYQDNGVATCIHPRIADNRNGLFKNTEFTLNSDNNSCTCPAGHSSNRRVKSKTRFRYQYRFGAEMCNSCRLKQNCTTCDSGRVVSFFQGRYFSEARALAESSEGKKLFRARQIVAEGVIGEAKDLHLLRRCRYRSIEKFRIQLFLTGSVINLKRLMKSKCKRSSEVLDRLSIPFGTFLFNRNMSHSL